MFRLRPLARITVLAGSVFAALAAGAPAGIQSPDQGPGPLLPKPSGWTMSEAPQKYMPETLFEYINGGAESYLSYEFKELALGQYQKPGVKATMTAEIYDMKTPRNAFGIYGSERYSESKFLPIGVQGYIEDGALNFLAGRFYVKLLAYETGAETEAALKAFASEILKNIGDAGTLPAPLAAFPRSGLTPNSEKFILRDFLGMKFLSNGFTASYRTAAGEFDAFIIEAATEAAAAGMLKAYLDHFERAKQAVTKTAEMIRIKDPYLANILIAGTGRFLCGATKIKAGAEAEGEKVVRETVRALVGK